MRFVGIGEFASTSKSEAIVMTGDPEECRILASRCAEIAASDAAIEGMVLGSLREVGENSNRSREWLCTICRE
jgi:hypothetical protein